MRVLTANCATVAGEVDYRDVTSADVIKSEDDRYCHKEQQQAVDDSHDSLRFRHVSLLYVTACRCNATAGMMNSPCACAVHTMA